MTTKRHRKNEPKSTGGRRRTRIEPFVHGIIYGELFVVPRKEAIERARLNRALHSGRTWGEFTTMVPRRVCREVREVLEVARIAADRDISDLLEELVDHSYPPALGVTMLASLPSELDELVHREYSALGDEVPHLAADDLTRVLEVLATRGIPCDEDQALVVAAAGYDTDRPEEMRE